MEGIEKEIVQEWKTIYTDFAAIKTSEWYELQHKTAATCLMVEAISPILPSSLVEIDSSPVWSAKTTDGFSYKIEEINEICAGTLARPGMFNSKKWKSARFVLSESGYLHCFSIKNTPRLENKPYYSVCLVNPIAQVRMPEEKAHLYVMEISVGGKGGKKHLISCGSEKELIEWVAAIKKKIRYVVYLMKASLSKICRLLRFTRRKATDLKLWRP
jgi:hypothetical protein